MPLNFKDNFISEPDKIQNPDGSGKIDDFFPPFKKLLADYKFLDSLIKFDKDNIPPALIKKLEDRIISNELFDPKKIKVASTAAEGICKWLIAIVQYDKVAKVVAPKRIALKEAENARDVRFFSLRFVENLMLRYSVLGCNGYFESEARRIATC